MSTPPAGTTKKRLLSHKDYLAPLPIPTGRKPSDVLNTIWRKNEVFLDISNYIQPRNGRTNKRRRGRPNHAEIIL
ncbi:hypothetical protein C6382_21005 [Pseudomonas sp. BBP2017]|nr:hypothetical protein C6382_21005 [Pseudomonas sp. BBP2017]